MRVTVGMCGASGAVYGVRLVEVLARGGADVDLVATPAARDVMRDEVGLAIDADGRMRTDSLWPDDAVRERVTVHPCSRMHPPLASGSTGRRPMVICPCSLNTLGAVAAGLAGNLLQRAAQVALKEGAPLVLVVREAPLSAIALEAMLKLARAGATVLPASPAFYHKPASIGDLVDFVVARVLDRLDMAHDLDVRWEPHDEPRAE